MQARPVDMGRRVCNSVGLMTLLAKASKGCKAAAALPLKWVRQHPLLALHITYFVVLSLVGTFSLWAAPKAEPLPLVDALYNAVSAVTETGLASVPMHRFSLSDQITLLLLMVVGAQVFTSAIPLFLRRLLFRNLRKGNIQKRSTTGNLSCPHSEKPEGVALSIDGALHTAFPSFLHKGHIERGLSHFNIDAYMRDDHLHAEKPLNSPDDGSPHPAKHEDGTHHTPLRPILPSNYYVEMCLPVLSDDNTQDQLMGEKRFDPRQHAGLHPVEHKDGALFRTHSRLIKICVPLSRDNYMQNQAMADRALVIMSCTTACHYVFSVLIGFLVCQICIMCSPHASGVLEKNNINSGLFAIFATVSAFGNCGYILLDDNMVPLQRSWVMLLTLSTVVLLGNTLYAPTMRFWMWMLFKASKGETKKVLEHILERRHRCYTHLFPSRETLWLVGSVVFLNTFQVMCMLGLDWGSKAFQGLGAGYKLVDALFQSIAARTGGMNVVNLADFSSATLFATLVAMYIKSYPIYPSKELTADPKWNFFVSQLYKLKTKAFFLFAAIFFICLFERQSLKNDSLNFSFFNILYEVISSYGNVGLTLGYNCALKTILTSDTKCVDSPIAFSGRWSVRGKMVLIMVMLFGRHRNLFEDYDWDITHPLTPS